MSEDILYVLPSAAFFKDGYSGKVRHAQGIEQGFIEVGCDVYVLCESSGRSYLSGVRNIYVNSFLQGGLFGELVFALLLLIHIAKSPFHHILIRKNLPFIVVNTITFGVFLKRKKVTWEVNGLSGVDIESSGMRGRIIRLLHRFCLSKGRVYCVSEKLKLLTEDIVSENIARYSIKCIPNGSPTYPRRRVSPGGTHLDIFFFGVLQEYNDFEGLVSNVLRFNKENGARVSLSLKIIGFGAQHEIVKTLSQRHNCIEFLGRKTPDEFYAISCLSPRPLAVVPTRSLGRSEILSPIKLYEYASIGLPTFSSGLVTEVVGWSFLNRYSNFEDFQKGILGMVIDTQYIAAVDNAYRFSRSNTWGVRCLELRQLIYSD